MNVYFVHIIYYICHKYCRMKRLVVFSILFFALISCRKEMATNEMQSNADDASASNLASKLGVNEKVKLLKARTVATYYAASQIKEKAFYVEVANMGLKKQVFVHHKMSDGTWKDLALKYISIGTDSATLLYGLAFNYGVGTPLAATYATVGFGDQFAIKYVVDGQANWDNNQGVNYSIANPLATDGMYMQNGLHVSSDIYHSQFSTVANGNALQIYADVRNIAFNKEVTLVYTTNNWTTVKYAPLNYANTYAFGGANYSINPTERNFEKWTVTLTPNASVNTIKYAIRYKVNGVEYWDNNYGRNYLIKRL